MPVAETAETFASPTTAKLLERLAYQINVTIHSHHAEAIHDLRVAVRRFDQSVAAFRQLFPSREVKRIRRRLKDLMQLAGEVRDCDVGVKLLAKCKLPSAAPVKEAALAHRKAAVAVLVAALRRWGARRWSSKWRGALVTGQPEDGLRHHLPRLARKFLAHGKSASGKASVKELHQFRIEAKKFRYTLELFQPLYGAPVHDWLDRLKPVQSLLGDIHDCRMARAMAGRFDGTPELDDWLKRRQRRKSRAFRGLWEETFATPANHRLWVEALRHPPRKPMGRSAAKTAALALHA